MSNQYEINWQHVDRATRSFRARDNMIRARGARWAKQRTGTDLDNTKAMRKEEIVKAAAESVINDPSLDDKLRKIFKKKVKA